MAFVVNEKFFFDIQQISQVLSHAFSRGFFYNLSREGLVFYESEKILADHF